MYESHVLPRPCSNQELETEIARLEGEVSKVRSEIKVLTENPDVQEKGASLASADTISQMQRDLETKRKETEALQTKLQKTLDALFGARS